MPRDNQSRSSRAAASIAAVVVACKASFANAQAGRIGQAQSSPPPHRVVGLAQQSCQSRRSSKAAPRSYTLRQFSRRGADPPHA
jgi:hypothetical protein